MTPGLGSLYAASNFDGGKLCNSLYYMGSGGGLYADPSALAAMQKADWQLGVMNDRPLPSKLDAWKELFRKRMEVFAEQQNELARKRSRTASWFAGLVTLAIIIEAALAYFGS